MVFEHGQTSVIPIDVAIPEKIYLIRGHKVMLSPDLADLYDVEPRALIQAVKRNPGRLPDDFMFQLNEVDKGRGRYPKHRPYAFTE